MHRMTPWSVHLLTVLIATSSAAQEPAAELHQAREAAAASREAMQDGFHVQYEVRRQVLDSAERHDYVPMPSLDHWAGEHARNGNQSFDVTVANPKTSNLRKEAMNVRIDTGVRSVVISGQSANVDLRAGESDSKAMLPEEDLFFEAIGQESRRQGVGVTLRGPGNPQLFDLLKVLASADYSATVAPVADEDSPSTLVLEIPGVDKVWLDARYGYGIVRRVWQWPEGKNGQGHHVEISNSDWERLEGGVWIPRRVEVTYYAQGDGDPQPAVRQDLTVVSASLQPADDLFNPGVDLRAGASVFNRPLQHAGQLPANDPKTLARYLIEPKVVEAELLAERSGGGGSGVRVLIIALVAVSIIAAAALWLRLRSASR